MLIKHKIYIVHYSKQTNRVDHFNSLKFLNIDFRYITEKNIFSLGKVQKFEETSFSLIFNLVRAIHIGHVANLTKSRKFAEILLFFISLLIKLECIILGENQKIFNYFVNSVNFTVKLNELNMMHAEALSVSAGECDFCIILEDDSIINADVILSELKSIIEFLKLNKRSIVFFSETNVRIKKTIEDLVQKNKKFISVKPSISRGAGAYIVHRSIAINLCEYIKTKNIPLPIDMLITFWALENKILSYWVSKPFVIEGSGRVYKSSLR